MKMPASEGAASRWIRRALLVVALIPGLAACAGSRSSIVARDASYPVSLSPVVRDPEGRLLHDEDLEEVGEFSFDYQSNHMFFTLIPLSQSHYDLSTVIDEQVEREGGEAVVDFAVKAHHNDWTYFCVLLGFGILPAYSDVSVSGRIVRRRDPRTTDPAPEPAD